MRSDHGLTVCARSGTSGAWDLCCFGHLRLKLNIPKIFTKNSDQKKNSSLQNEFRKFSLIAVQREPGLIQVQHDIEKVQT